MRKCFENKCVIKIQKEIKGGVRRSQNTTMETSCVTHNVAGSAVPTPFASQCMSSVFRYSFWMQHLQNVKTVGIDEGQQANMMISATIA